VVKRRWGDDWHFLKLLGSLAAVERLVASFVQQRNEVCRMLLWVDGHRGRSLVERQRISSSGSARDIES